MESHAMAAATAPKVTAKEFLQMDLGGVMHELDRGEIVEMTPPEYAHGYICGNFYRVLDSYGRTTHRGHAGTNDSRVVISDDTVRGADVCYYREDRWPRSRVGKEAPPGPPDLVVEVVSPSDRTRDIMQKVVEYLRVGIPCVWVAEPTKRTLTIYRHDDPTPAVLGGDAVVEGLPELPGFRCAVAELFD
jgi:Uma2 family endonuclease